MKDTNASYQDIGMFLEFGPLGERELRVDFEYYRGYPGSRDQPPEEPSIEISMITMRVGKYDVDITHEGFVNEDLMDQCWDWHNECREASQAQYDDQAYEAHKERLMESRSDEVEGFRDA